MKKSKKNFKKSIFFSHISIIIVFSILTAIVFNICLKLYIKKETKAQLITATNLIHKSTSNDLLNLNIKPGFKSDEKNTARTLLKISKTLKQTGFLLDINYAVIGKNLNVIFPLIESNEESQILKNEVLPALEKAKTKEEIKNLSVFYFNTLDKEYVSTLYPLKLENGDAFGYLFLYSNLDKSNDLIVIVNLILLSILLITSIIAFIISKELSKRISNPISNLSNYAKQIGERQYSVPNIKFDDDEIGELGETMKTMAEKLYAYDNTIKTFLQNASHELRTPLMSIQGYAEGIKYGVMENSFKAVEIIIEESKRITGIVEDLLYLSKIDSFQEILNLDVINCEDLLRSCIERVKGIAIEKQIEIQLVLYCEEIYFSGDEDKLSRAIMNILGNSLRYAKQNIKITLYKSTEQVQIKIKDDGIGFEEKDLQNIFERFYKGKGGNYGLGLSIAKTIVEKHSGTIIAENHAEGGALFKIILPIKKQ